MKMNFSDWLWVFWTFVRGRILRQRGFIPQQVSGGYKFSGLNLLVVPPNRLMKLMEWWGIESVQF